ncbi:MAG: hypothetical protein RTU30_01765 [Candidatus Thorarchaeota archaeon]
MNPIERYVQLWGEVSNFTERLTGVPLVDAYFGPEELGPKRQTDNKSAQDLSRDLGSLIDDLAEVKSDLRRKCVTGETKSIALVVDWLGGADISYTKLVEGLFNIRLSEYSDYEIDGVISELDEALSSMDGSLRERISRYRTEGDVSGEELREVIVQELQPKSHEVADQFRELIYKPMGVEVTDNGVVYRTVRNEPWSGYNYYQGGFRSINEFNIDRSMNKRDLLAVIYHEYEHHVSNLWREKAYRDKNFLDLTVVPLHTGRCVISEGTADTAKDFLGISDSESEAVAFDALRRLSRMVSINAALFMNRDGFSVDETINYIADKQMKTVEEAKHSIDFIRPTNPDGRPNFWAPYIFTYFIGRTQFVKPTFDKAKAQGKEVEFFKTLYLNPYSASSVTWNEAYAWL